MLRILSKQNPLWFFRFVAGALLVCTSCLAQSFEVATIKPTSPESREGRYMKMLSPHRFVVKNYSLQRLICIAYDLNPKAVSGGPAWMTEDTYEILALTGGEKTPTREEQMAMLRTLLAERFHLQFHRVPKEFAIYSLTVARGGSKLKASAAPADEPAALIGTVYPQRIQLPARNATMLEFALVLQRAFLDRPVLDRTGLTGRYDFNLEWAPDETQLGGDVPAAPPDASSPPFFTAVQEQLGLKLEPGRGTIQTIVVDQAERPVEN